MTALPDGRMQSGVMIVTDHPYASDNPRKWEKTLVGRGGSLMGRAFSRKQWVRDTFNYQALLREEPPTPLVNKFGVLNAGMRERLDAARPALDAEIRRLRPKVILTFGEVAAQELTGITNVPLLMMHGYAFWHPTHACWIVPTFHPEKLCQGQTHLTQVFLWDAAKAVRMAAEGYAYETPECLMDPPLAVWEAYVQDYLRALEAHPYDPLTDTGTVLAGDIETPWKRKHSDDEDELDTDAPFGDITYNIERVSFAFERNRGASVPWAMPYLIGIEEMVRATAARGMLPIWNRPFDRPRLAHALQTPLPLTRCRDTMDSWHTLFNALPKKLGFATSCLPGGYSLRMWKHLSQSEPAYYSCVDAIALWRNDQDIMRLLRLSGAESVYNLICRDLDPILERMVGAGLLVDQGKQAELHAELQARARELQGEMESVVPVILRRKKVWQTRRAAEKGLALLQADGTLDNSAQLEDHITEKMMRVCSACGNPATQAHITRKFLTGVSDAKTD